MAQASEEPSAREPLTPEHELVDESSEGQTAATLDVEADTAVSPVRTSKSTAVMTLPPRLELGASGGLSFRRSDDAALVDYGVGHQVGGFARVQLEPWMHVRLVVATESLGVTPEQGFASVTVVQPRLRGTRIGLGVEPTWRFGSGVETWLALGATWERLTALPFQTEPNWASVPRSGVFLELPVGIGLGAEVVPGRLRASLTAQWATIVGQTGELFESTQAIDDAGLPSQLPGLTKVRGAFAASVFVGVLL